MEPSPGQGPRVTGDANASGEFFVPDLCAPRSVFVMVLLVELMVLVHTLASSALPRFNWELLATSSLLVQWVVLLSAALLCQLRQPFSRLSLPVVTMGCLLVVLAVTAVSSVAWQQLPLSGGGSVDRWWLLRNLLVAAVLSGIMLRYFYLQQQLRLREQLELQARLDSLRARIRPHFLFNTLNSIASLIVSRPRVAERAVEDLSELFRVSLQDHRRSTTVADELRLCELYLEIEKLRLGDRLQVEWQFEGHALDLPMPSLILQPLVENAVYHGISQLPAGGVIRVTLAASASAVEAAVENPVPGQAAAGAGHHMALDNVRQRLHALYGAGARLRASRADGCYRVDLSYPVGGEQ